MNRPYAVEIKTKYQRVIDEMIAGDKGPDPQHVNQIMTYISLAHFYGKEYWPDLDECIGGSLLYVSRDNPSITKEFKFKFDKDWWETGTKRLLDWKALFIEGTLPDKPEGFMWSKGACKFCKFKKHGCKPDFQDNVTELSKSNAIDWANEHYNFEYDYEDTRQKVLNRWIKENE